MTITALTVWICAAALVCALWPVFAPNEPRPTIRPLTSDEKAAWGRYRIEAAAEVARRKSTRECDRRRYEGITWPKIQWEKTKREIIEHVIQRGVAS